MDNAEKFLHIGVSALMAAQTDFDLRQKNYEGDQQLPYAPEGVSLEYHELRKHCLLYTSPSPRDRQKSRMPSSA